MHVTVNILSWNDLRYLSDLFASLQAQTYKDVTVRVLANGSTDGATEYILREHPRLLAVRNVKNQGFAGGHNQLLRLALERSVPGTEHAIMIMNTDMILAPNAIEELVKALEEHPETDAVQPKLLRAYAEHGETDVETVRSDILDTTGMVVHAGWRMADRGAGEMDNGQYDTKTDIFAPTGTMFMIRESALRDVMIDGEMFDGDFFAYREDCDFALRFRRAGHKSLFVPGARAHHYRGMFGEEKRSLWKRLKDRRKQRPFLAALATRNQLFVLIKNLTFVDVILSSPRIVFGEGGRLLYGFLFEPETRKTLLSVPRLLPAMWRKRRATLALARVPGAEMRAYMTKG